MFTVRRTTLPNICGASSWALGLPAQILTLALTLCFPHAGCDLYPCREHYLRNFTHWLNNHRCCCGFQMLYYTRTNIHTQIIVTNQSVRSSLSNLTPGLLRFQVRQLRLEIIFVCRSQHTRSVTLAGGLCLFRKNRKWYWLCTRSAGEFGEGSGLSLWSQESRRL